MTIRHEPANAPALPDLTFTRVIAAPRSLVFAAWTDPRHVARWWGPHGFTNPVCEIDLRPGGVFRVHMRGPDGALYPGEGRVLEVVAPERLVFTSTYEGDGGRRLIEAHNTVTFTERDGKTTLTLRARVTRAAPEAAKNLGGMEAGWTQSLERLAQVVAGMRSDT